MSARPSTRSGSRPGLALLAIVLLSTLGALILATRIPLVDPDEGRNAEVAREMAASGDLVVPHLAGMPYLDKPPALFWASALAIRAFGPSRWAPRLPAVLAAAATLLLLASLARRAGGRALAWRSAALLAVAPLFAILSAYVIFDMALALAVTIFWTQLARELLDGPSVPRRAAMSAAIALGILIKGPVMLAWALGGSVCVGLLLRSRSPLRWAAWLPGWAIALAIPAAWFALATSRFPEYPRYAFLEESLERLTRPSFDRNQPWWFTPVVLMAGALPWSFVTPWATLRKPRGAGDADLAGGAQTPGSAAPPVAAPARDPRPIATAVTLGFVLFALLFFMASRSKLVTYLLPAMPAFALAAGIAWQGRLARGSRGWHVAFAACLVALPLTLAIGWPALNAAATRESSEALAQAILAEEHAASRPLQVRFERCYSPGADFLMNRRSEVVSPRADQTTSVYQARYRESLRARGLWTLRDEVSGAREADVIVRPVPDDVELPEGAAVIHQGRRFTAYRVGVR